jgi:hypothetical protein
MAGDDLGPRTVAVAALGLVVVNYPVLAVLDGDGLTFGVPTLWVGLSVAWLGLIGLLAFVLRKG